MMFSTQALRPSEKSAMAHWWALAHGLKTSIQGFSTFFCSWPFKMIQYDGGPTTFTKKHKVNIVT